MSQDLFTSADQRKRERELERENLELRLLLANALSALKPRWDVQARAVRKQIRERIAA